MENSPELDGKFLGTISADFIKVCDNLKEAAYLLRARKISEYPIFIIAKHPLQLGLTLIEAGDFGNEWYYNFSMMEEMVQRGIIDGEKKELFISVYKNPDEFCCLFVVHPDFSNFVYIPYPED
jgi:hypothetical protein